MATRVGLTRQKVNYHLNALEAHGLVRLAQERTWIQERFPMPSETNKSE